ncbi:MAG TPA: hypothetical protein VIV09_14615 [Pseudolabrys sp.]
MSAWKWTRIDITTDGSILNQRTMTVDEDQAKTDFARLRKGYAGWQVIKSTPRYLFAMNDNQLGNWAGVAVAFVVYRKARKGEEE